MNFDEKLGYWVARRCRLVKEGVSFDVKDILQRISDYHAMALLCDSPIENAIGEILLFMVVDGRELSYGAVMGGESIGFFSQYPVGPYKADFMVLCSIGGKIINKIAIECDGHFFHEKTKEQAARDKKRDRFFVSQDIKVLRFSGSEIHTDPWVCGGEIMALLSSTFSGVKNAMV